MDIQSVQWKKGDALNPETFADSFPQVDGVVHTLGTLLEDGEYKTAVRRGNVPQLLRAIVGGITSDANPLKTGSASYKGSYEALNRDSALNVCQAFIRSPPPSTSNSGDRPFVYISAEDIFRPIVPSRYIETKREAERGLELLLTDQPHRGVYLRPSLVYHAHYRPLTSPAAVMFDISANLHAKAPQSFPTPSGLLEHLASAFPSSSASFQSIANAMTIPPIHVDHVAAATCQALENPDVRGVLGVAEMRKLLGWGHEQQ